MNENEKHETHEPTHSFAVVNYYVLFAELAPLAIISDLGQFSKLCCASNMACFDLICDFIVLLNDGSSDLGHDDLLI